MKEREGTIKRRRDGEGTRGKEEEWVGKGKRVGRLRGSGGKKGSQGRGRVRRRGEGKKTETQGN